MSERGWTTPADVRGQLVRLWDRGELLRARLEVPSSTYPLRPRLRRPSSADLSARFDEVRGWIRALDEGSKARRGFGYEIEWETVNHRQLGPNRVPRALVVASERDALALLGRQREADRFARLAAATEQRFPALGTWLRERPLELLGHAEEWDRILEVVEWFQRHVRSGLYLRQLDVPSVDSKFIEERRGLFSALLDRVLTPEDVVASAVGARAFEVRYGLRPRPRLVRFRVLDPRHAIGGFSDLSVPVEELAVQPLPTSRVFVTENEVNGLAFPAVEDAAVIFGLGYAVELLSELRWLRDRRVYYWGDLDTHGFAILDRLRAVLPQVRSLLMDRETLLAHRALWTFEASVHGAALAHLEPAERELYDELRSGALGAGVRLEQERIGFGRVAQAIEGVVARD